MEVRLNTEQRLLVNSCLEKLVESEGRDEEAAKTVISLLHNIPSTRKLRAALVRKKKDDSITAHTSEAGDITVSDENKGIKTTHITREPERIGNYRIYKLESGKIIFTQFQDFEKSILTDDDVPKFGIEFDLDTLEYLSFFSITKKVYRIYIFSFSFGITRELMNVIYEKSDLRE